MSSRNKPGRREVVLATGGLGLAALAGFAWRAGRSQASAAARGVSSSTEPAAPGAPAAEAHLPFGPVDPPRAAPSVSLLGADGAELDLAAWLKGRPTAVQLIFTRCTSTCPIQGALFAAIARKLERGARVLSVSIDPEHDTPARLRAWMERFGSNPVWYAASPRDTAGVDAVFDFLRGRAQGLDRHSLQAYLFDTQGRLAYRTADLPAPSEVVSALGRLA